MFKKAQQGFTLIELMIVVAIIGILAAVAIPAYQDYIVKAKLSKVQSTLDSLKLALALYNQENGSFPNGTATATPTTTTGSAFWTSLGITKVTLPTEVAQIDLDGTNGTYVTMKLTLASNIKATSIDGLTFTIKGDLPAGATATTWTCSAKTITDPIAIKYFSC